MFATSWPRALLRFALATAVVLGLTANGRAATQDITSQFSITRSTVFLNRATNTYDSSTTLTNVANAPALGALNVVVSGLPSSVTLANKTGVTADGKPYVTPLAAGATLASGSSLSFTLRFNNPQRISFPSVLQVLYTPYEPPAGAPALFGAVATGGTNAFLIGRLEGANEREVALQVSTAKTCVLGTLVAGTTVGSPIVVTTDSSGYFGIAAPGVDPGDFVALQATSAPVGLSPVWSPSSGCLVSARDNDSWPKAFELTGVTPSVQDLIDAPGKVRWYKFPVTPGQRIDIKLTGLPADYDLAVFRDIGQVFASQFTPATASPNDLLKLTAEYAPTVFSPTVFSPTVFSPTVFSPDAYAPTVFSPTVFSPTVFSPTVFSPTVFSPTVFSPTVFSPTVFSPTVFSPTVFSPTVFSPTVFSEQEIAQAFSTAQTRSIVAVSANPGSGDEFTVVNTWNRTGYFYARVAGRKGAFDSTTPFKLSVAKGATTCTGVTDTTLVQRPAQPNSGLKTVIVTDSSKVALDSTLPGPAGVTLRDKLATLASRSEVLGVLVDVKDDARVKALREQAAANPACPFAKNLLAEEIKNIIDAYRANPLQYVVLVGNDDAIPFFRSPDQAGLAPESGFVPPVESNSSSEASLRLDFVLSQDRYGSKTTISLPWNDFPVPGLAVGRLVESASDIAGLLDAYAETDATIVPRSTLVTGYDFLEDAANEVKGELDAGTGSGSVSGVVSDALITPNGKSPQDPASWKAADLRAKLFGSRHDVIFLAGHFSANSALAADFASSVLTTELAASTTDFTNAIVFSAGCHSGYNLVDTDAIAGVTLPLDWAQAFARKRATLIAGTGYQYGDTDFLEYSERLYKGFAQQLRAGPAGTAVSVGTALVHAKLAYLATTPDIRGLHEKALLQATLFGLPMLGVNMPAGRGAIPGTAAAISPDPVSGPSPAATLGLHMKDIGVAPNLVPHAQALRNLETGTEIMANWLSGPDGVVSKAGEPALPLAVVNVTPDDARLVLRGIGYRGGTFVDSGAIFPFSGAPTTETRGVHVPFLTPVDYPAMMWTPNYFGALAGTGGTQLLLTPVQHRAASVANGTSIQRRHTQTNLRLFYSGNLSQAALSDGPSIIAVEAVPDAGGITFSVQVVGDPAAAIYQVWSTYTGTGMNAWTSLDLEQCARTGSPTPTLPAVCGTNEDSRWWRGRLASPPANLKFLVQAANGVGLVSRNDNLGAYFAVAQPTPTATKMALVSPPTSATAGDNIDVTARLTYAGGAAISGKTVAVSGGGVSQLGATGADGSVTVKLPVVATAGVYQIAAAFAGDETFQPSSTTSPVTFVKAAATPTPVSASVASAGVNITASLGGTTTAPQQVTVAFTVTGPSGTTTIYATTDNLGNAVLPPPSGLPAGDYTVTQAAFGGDGTYAPTSIALSQTFTVPKIDQSIAFDPLPNKSTGDPDFLVFATASSALPVAFAASGSCTVTGSNVHITGAGSCTITANQAGDANTNAAAPVARSFTIDSLATVASVNRAGPDPTMGDDANAVAYTVSFSEPVTGVSASNFAVETTGITGASVASVSGAGTTWTVSVNTGRGSGSLRVDMINGIGITNGSGAAVTGLPFTGQTYQVDKGGTVLGSGEGQPVAAFGSGGYALFSDAQITAAPARLRIRANGRIVAVGGTACATNVNPATPAGTYCTVQIAQYLASGAPDTSFGTNGRVVTVITNAGFELNFALNADGTLLVGGYRYNGSADVPFVAKFTSSGAVDPSFGTNGVTTLNALPLGFGIVGFGIDNSGRIVFVGTTPNVGAQGEDVFVTRLTSSGATDSTFGVNGVAQFAIATAGTRNDRGTTFNVQPDDYIVLGGRTVNSGGSFDFLLMRIDGSGAPDPSFGTSGVVTTRLAGTTGDNLGRRLLVQPDGKIVMVGTVGAGAATQCGVTRHEADGTPDLAFGSGGQLLLPVSVGCFDLTQQSDGKIVIIGSNRVGGVTYGTLIRLLPSGALDAAFGAEGYQNISSYGTPGRIAVTSTGNLVTSLVIQDPADGVLKSYVVQLSGTLAGPWLAQSITFDPLADSSYGDVFTVAAAATSGLPVTFAAAGSCAVSGNTVQLSGVGSCAITASQPGNATWFAATPVPRTFAVGAATQTTTFGAAPAGLAVGHPPAVVSASSASPTAAPSTNPIIFTSLTPAVCTVGGINGAFVGPISAGTCTIAANQAGEAHYASAPQKTLSFTIDPLPASPPQTYTVINLNDGGTGSLRWAIEQANAHPGPDFVDFDPVVFPTIGTPVMQTITLSGQIQISDPLTITGPGADRLTIDGNGVLNATPWSRVFSIFVTDPACPALDGLNDYLVWVSGLRLVNGRNKNPDGIGGAIYTQHSLMLDSVIIENSAARSAGAVGFSVQYPGQTLFISNSQFLDNAATELVTPTSAVSAASGGAIYVFERCSQVPDLPYTEPVSMTIIDSDFRGNVAQPLTLNGRGGALRSFSRADIAIFNTVIVDNHVVSPDPPAAGRNYHGGAFDGTAKSLLIESSEISDNVAFEANPANDLTRSGGLHLFNDAVTRQAPGNAMGVRIINSTISGNQSSTTAGAMVVFGNIALELYNSTVSDNVALPNRTGGIAMSVGVTSPPSASDTARPTLRLVSSILANSIGVDVSAGTALFGPFTIDAANSVVENICPAPNCAISVNGTGNLIGVDPLLGLLTGNGGPSRTHAPLPGSPVINAGSNPFGLTTDQRGDGFPRTVGAGTDMGAFESASP
jgi:uncharacterized delta-60 repeat protein